MLGKTPGEGRSDECVRMGASGSAGQSGCRTGRGIRTGAGAACPAQCSLLSAVVQQSKALRSAEDLADELQFLAENLDDDQDYSFMRP